MEEPPIWISRAAALDEKAIGLVLGPFPMVNLLEKIEKKKKRFESFLEEKKFLTLDAEFSGKERV